MPPFGDGAGASDAPRRSLEGLGFVGLAFGAPAQQRPPELWPGRSAVQYRVSKSPDHRHYESYALVSTPEAPSPKRRRHRRRRRGHAGEHSGAGRPDQRGLPRPSSTLTDGKKSAAAPLSAAEKAELKEHLAFIAKYRRELQLPVNDTENQLLLSVREPEDRGVCLHLLGKIDRSLIAAMLSRVQDRSRRTAILAGVVRFSRDVAILIQYLECLGQSVARSEAAATVMAALPELDYGAVSAAQMRRVLELIATLLPKPKRPLAVFSLLQSASFRRAFDQARETLPEGLASSFAPMRAVVASAFGDAREESLASVEELDAGLVLLLEIPTSELARLPLEARARVLAAAFERRSGGEATERATVALLGTLPAGSRRATQLTAQRARQLIAAGRESEAKQLLEELRQHHPDYQQPARWLQALAAPRMGRVALVEEGPRGRLRRALWLEGMRPVWAIVGSPPDAASFEQAAAVHSALVLSGVAPLLASGVGSDGAPYIAVAMCGEPLPQAFRHLRKEPARLADCLRAAVELFAGLARAGLVVPDAELHRFTLDREYRFCLSNLTGCGRADVAAAEAAALVRARELCRMVLNEVGTTAATPYLRSALAAPSLHAAARALALV